MGVFEEESEEADVCLPQGSRWTFQATTMDGSFVSAESQPLASSPSPCYPAGISFLSFLLSLSPSGIAHHLPRADAGESPHLTVVEAVVYLADAFKD